MLQTKIKNNIKDNVCENDIKNKLNNKQIIHNYITKYLKINIFKFLLYFIIFLVAFSVNICGKVNDCGLGVYSALTFFNNNLFLINLSCFLSLIVLGKSKEQISIYFILLLLCILRKLLHKKIDKKYLSFSSIFEFVLIIFLHILIIKIDIQKSLLFLILNVFSYFSLLITIKIIKNRKYNLILETDEKFCVLFLICLLFCSLNSFNLFVIDIVKLFGIFSILCLSKILNFEGEISFCIASGIGCLISNNNFEYLAYFCIIGLFLHLLKNNNKFFSLLFIIGIDLLFELFFNFSQTGYLYGFLSILISVILFLIFEKKVEQLKNRFFVVNNYFLTKEIAKNERKNLYKKLILLGNSFEYMNKDYKSLMTGEIDEKELKQFFHKEVIRENCENCPNKLKCLKNYEENFNEIFEDLTNICFEKGKITLLDLPQFLNTRCIKTNGIIYCYNQLIEKYKDFVLQNKNIDKGKLLIANELYGVAQVFRSLANETIKETNINEKLSKSIKESLIYNNIVVNEVVCSEKGTNNIIIEIIANKNNCKIKEIKNIIYKKFKIKLFLEQTEKINELECFCLRFKNCSNYDLAVGIAKCNKMGEKNCGDNYSVFKIGENKILLSICDGMGHGEKAQKISNTVANLVENFYRAGLDDNSILCCINSLLCLQKKDDFCGLDLSIIDLNSGETTFIKQGATNSFIVSKKLIKKIAGSGIPIGILEHIDTKTTKTVIGVNDIIFLFSDGISDCFESDEKLENFLLSIKNKNVQEMAEIILDRAKSNQKNYPKDDMSVIVGKMFYN